MRALCGAVLVLVAAGTVAGEDKKPVKLEGTYLITGIEIAGEKLPAEFFTKGPEAERTLKVTADKMIMTKGGKEDPATYKIDATKTPAQIDFVSKKDGGKEEKMFGIFKVDGDTLTICAVESEKADDRPKEFKTTKDGKAMIMTLTKKKEK